MTLDTVSIRVTQYNNTAVTHTITQHGNIKSVDVSTISEAWTLANAFASAGDSVEYFQGIPVLGNISDGRLDKSVTIPYPTPYLAISGLRYASAKSSVLPTSGSCPTLTDVLDLAQPTDLPLNATYFEALKASSAIDSNLAAQIAGPFDVHAFRAFLTSASVFKSHPELKSCPVWSVYNGPPVLKIPAHALTATARTTVKSAGQYSSSVPAAEPASVISPLAASQTMGPASPTPNADSPDKANPFPLGILFPDQPEPSSPSPVDLPDQSNGQEIVNTPLGAPVDAPTNVPVQHLASTPMDAAANRPGDSQVNEPVNAPLTTPADSQGNTPADIPADTPADTPANTPINTPAEPGQAIVTPITSPVLTFGESIYTPDTSSNFVVVGQTLTPGSAATTISNTLISLAPGGLAAVIGTSTQILATLPSPAELKFAGSTFTADASSNIQVAGQTLQPGRPGIVVSGTPIALAPGGATAVVGSSTQVLTGPTPARAAAAAPAFLTFGGATYTANPASQFVLSDQTLTPGGSIAISGTPIALALGASYAVIGSSTQQLSNTIFTPAPVLTFAGSTYTASASSAFIIGGQTLSRGGVITAGGTALSFDQAGTAVVVSASTQTLSTAAHERVIIFGGSTYTADASSSAFIIAGQTLTKGGVITVQGTPISYGAAATDVVIGTSAEAVRLGEFIASGFGASPTGPAAPATFTGGAGRRAVVSGMGMVVVGVGVWVAWVVG